jgi:uncharacterized membrane protein
VESIDLVRGFVMVLMALDHVRGFFHSSVYPATDLAHVSAALFVTRLVTHLCAPAFVFLAGTSAYLSGVFTRSRSEQSRYLLTRGIWLIVLELTLVSISWSFRLNFEVITLQVIWVLGWSMILLAGLIWLPLSAITVIGAGMVFLHNLLDRWGLRETLLPYWLWSVLHVPADLSIGAATHLLVLYPLVPWVGVMALGYVFGAEMATAPAARRTSCVIWGLNAVTAFALLRASNLYGDPVRWTAPVGRSDLFAVLAFFNTTKSPPSLLFLLMTLGVMFLMLAAADGWHPTTPLLSRLRGAFLTLGRVPLFYYLVHLPLIHALAWLDRSIREETMRPKTNSGHDLLVVYAVWLVVVLILYPLCVRYDAYKRAHPGGWSRYV